MAENNSIKRFVLMAAIAVVTVLILISAGITIYLYRETADIRGLAKSNAAKIELNIETIRTLREQIIRVEEEQKRRTSRVGIVEDLKRRVEELEKRR